MSFPMEMSITWVSKHTVRPLSLHVSLRIRFFSLLITSVVIGIFSLAFFPTQSLAKSSSKPMTFTPVPKANIALASTQGAPIEQHATVRVPQPYIPFFSPSPSTSSLNATTIFQQINLIRQQNSLPPFQEDSRLCTLATSRAPEIPNEIATGTMHQGMYARNLPYWNNENIIDINSEEAAVNWWMSDYIHKAAILGNFQFSCVACSGNACAEEFSNFNPK